jgi:hypothetical protein
MLKQTLLCTLLLILLINHAKAQFTYGFSAGTNVANAKYKYEDGRAAVYSYLARLMIVADVGYYFDENWGLHSGVYYSGKGWRERYDLDFDTFVVKLNYIEIPLKVSYRLQEQGEKNLFIMAGFYGAYGLNGQFSTNNTPRGNYVIFPQKSYDPFERKVYKRFDLGYTVESAYILKNNYGIKIGYSHGLLNIYRDGTTTLKNFLFSASLCILLK